MSKNFNIIRPVGLKPKPDKYEERVAELLAEKFQSDIAFVLRGTRTTPDILVVKTGEYWKIKNIRGSGKHAIEDNLRKASKQSKNVIISLLKPSELTAARVQSRVQHLLKTTNIKLNRVLLVTRSGKIIDIK